MRRALLITVTLSVWSGNALLADGAKKTSDILMCAPNGSGERTFFMDPYISSDFWNTGIGLSWTLLVSAKEVIAGQEYLVGQLVSPRGSRQPNVGYVLAEEWDCAESAISSNG